MRRGDEAMGEESMRTPVSGVRQRARLTVIGGELRQRRLTIATRSAPNAVEPSEANCVVTIQACFAKSLGWRTMRHWCWDFTACDEPCVQDFALLITIERSHCEYMCTRRGNGRPSSLLLKTPREFTQPHARGTGCGDRASGPESICGHIVLHL